MKHTSINGITYDCSISYKSEQLLRKQSHEGVLPPPPLLQPVSSSPNPHERHDKTDRGKDYSRKHGNEKSSTVHQLPQENSNFHRPPPPQAFYPVYAPYPPQPYHASPPIQAFPEKVPYPTPVSISPRPLLPYPSDPSYSMHPNSIDYSSSQYSTVLSPTTPQMMPVGYSYAPQNSHTRLSIHENLPPSPGSPMSPSYMAYPINVGLTQINYDHHMNQMHQSHHEVIHGQNPGMSPDSYSPGNPHRPRNLRRDNNYTTNKYFPYQNNH